jgi:hypothetical protein
VKRLLPGSGPPPLLTIARGTLSYFILFCPILKEVSIVNRLVVCMFDVWCVTEAAIAGV